MDYNFYQYNQRLWQIMSLMISFLQWMNNRIGDGVPLVCQWKRRRMLDVIVPGLAERGLIGIAPIARKCDVLARVA